MRGVAELLRAAFDGLTRERQPDDRDADATETPEPSPDELPARRVLGDLDWISDQPRAPRERPRIITTIRDDPARAIGDLSRPAALGTLIEGAMAFALDDAIDGNCGWIDIRLRPDGSAMVTHAGSGFAPDRASRGLQRWPWLRRSPEGEIMLTRNLAAPVVTCALSHWCRLEICRADGVYRQAFYRGEPECALSREPFESAIGTYTRVHFRPDATIFGAAQFDIDDLYMRSLGFLMELTEIEIRIYDERGRGHPLIMTGTGNVV